MKKLFAFIIIIFVFCLSAFAFSTEALQQLWDVSTGEVKAQTVKTHQRNGVLVEEVYYASRPYKRNAVKIFGYYAYPIIRGGKLPAILLSHGGGGLASRPRVEAWAKRGYAVLSIDLPGQGENRLHSRSTGPDMIVPNLLRTQPDPTYNYLVHAVAAARNGITYLTQRKEVDPDRIGMIGLSWGGVLTLLTNGQDRRLKAAVNVFGAGYIPEGCTWEDCFFSMPANDKATWNDYLDPKNFLATQHAPILFITGTNDHCYYLPIFQKSYEEVVVEKNIWLIPNLRHRFLASAQNTALAWFERKLKQGKTFPQLSELDPSQKSAEEVDIPVRAASHSRINSAKLFYTTGGPNAWTNKKWQTLTAKKKNGLFSFSIPTNLIKPEILYYVSVQDNHGGAASTLARSLFAVKMKDGTRTFAVSSPINKIFRKEKPIKLLNGQETGNAYFYFSKADQAYEFFQVN